MTSGVVTVGTVLRVFSGYSTTVFDFVCWNGDFTVSFINGYAVWNVLTSPVSVIAFLDSDGLRVGFIFWRISDFQGIGIRCWSDRG